MPSSRSTSSQSSSAVSYTHLKMPRTQREVAKKLGISRSYVSRIEKRALQKLEEAMGERE